MNFHPREKHCNVFFERFPQFASVFATEMTLGRCHGTPKRVAKKPAFGEDKGMC